MILAFFPVVVFLGLIAWFAFREQGRRYEQIVRILMADRDAARTEARVFRNLLAPAIARAENPQPAKGDWFSPDTLDLLNRNVAGMAAAAGKKERIGTQGDATPNPLANRRVPFRIRFKQAMKATNTKQQKTDALASALENQKPSQEKVNV
jgi:hypothetical protein